MSGRRFDQHLDADLAGRDFPQCDDRRLVAVRFQLSACSRT